MFKKSQAALEFLTTYAWALLSIMIALGALYYFGIFDFSKFLPQECNFPSQFECLDFTFVSTPTNEVRFRLVNNLGEIIDVSAFTIENNAIPLLSCSPPAPFTGWQAGEEKDLVFTSCIDGAFLQGERNEVKISMTYCAPATAGCPPHTVNGKITAVVT